jgi:membrane protease YdiL (CAAX protease family)
LTGHLTWVLAGSCILWAIPRPPPFFQSLLPRMGTTTTTTIKSSKNEDPFLIDGPHQDLKLSAVTRTPLPPSLSTREYHWFSMSLRKCNWLWWTIGGYYVSSWLFNVVDMVNRYVLPMEVLQGVTESVVSQLVQPEQNDIWASIIGYTAPCVTAPVWEELLYRGFLLAGLTSWTGSYRVSCIVQAIIFSAHHMSITAALPLAALGYTWAILYTKSMNLWTVIAVHAM